MRIRFFIVPDTTKAAGAAGLRISRRWVSFLFVTFQFPGCQRTFLRHRDRAEIDFYWIIRLFATVVDSPHLHISSSSPHSR